MRVAVEILASRLFFIDTGDDATVADLKRKIGEQEKLPFDRLILLIRHSNGISTIMTGDEDYLHHYGVGDGSLVYLFFSDLGGNDDNPDRLLSSKDSSGHFSPNRSPNGMWLDHDNEEL